MLNAKKHAKKSEPRRAGKCYGSNDSGCDNLQGKQKVSVALRFQEQSLRHSDIQLLRGPHALNERILGFYYAYMQARRYKLQQELQFLTPPLVSSLRHLEQRDLRRLAKQLQLPGKQFIFMPLVERQHWSLLLVSRPDRKFFYFDSEDNYHLQLARALYERLLAPLLAEDFLFRMGRCLQQSPGKGYESGVHLMCMTEHLADYVLRCGYATSTLLISKQEVLNMRGAQLQLIRTLGGILPKGCCQD
ncbi:CG1503 [Drosophila busckii]|uniref:CG1503 n=1 Tax=Drosophila busckii TaxID=30019 RepID=A0A0M4ER50_DROBS|nr:sentrin-specific protease 8 [Drosophila busckii]ALC48540.1 CG1503 [Drosophila busckii]